MKDALQRRSASDVAPTPAPTAARSRRDGSRLEVGSHVPHRFADVSILPLEPEEEEEEIEEPEMISLPENGGGGGGGAGGGSGRILGGGQCDSPTLMRVVIGGPFKHGLTMDDYYPTLSGHEYWGHAGSGGPFRTSKYVGSNIQLSGLIPASCDPRDFRLKQTVEYVVDRVNGSPHPLEGQVRDDLADAGQDASRAPFRRETRDAAGIHISMGDAPAARLRGQENLELDRRFETSLVGPAGSVTSTWETSIRIVNGRVTKNEIS
jgi:hypothetical protein